MRKITCLLLLFLLGACSKKGENTKPYFSTITESVYASGFLKSKNQYDVYPRVTGIIETVLVNYGDEVEKGQPLFLLYDESQRISKQNAALNKQFSDIRFNQGKLKDAKNVVENAQTKLANDSSLYFKQKTLWKENIGTKVDLDQKEMVYKNSLNDYSSALLKYNDLKRQLEFNSEQSRKGFLLSDAIEQDYIIRSEIKGKVYSVSKEKGEMVGVQTPVAVIGDSKEFLLEMQVDEFDITKIKLGQKVIASFDSYKGQYFEAKIWRIEPMMNEQSKSFLVEAKFTRQPEIVYPNLTFEANIVIQTKQHALLIPRSYTLDDEYVWNKKGEKIKITTGLMDYEKVEVLSGISEADEIMKPKQ
jgi:multidrug efflux pump subunit AcrA (membrane-fusion protein)